MKNIKQIVVTLVIAVFTFLNIFKLEMSVPNDEQAYTEYANNYLMLTGVCFILICGSYMSGEKNKFIDSSLMVNIGAYAVLVGKTLLKAADNHCGYDWTFIGIAIIAAFIHLLPTKHHKKNE